MLKKGDIVIVVLLVIAGISWLGVQFFWTDSENKQVVIEVDGVHYETLPINYNSTFKIAYPQDKFIQINIQDNQVWVENETVECPRKICIKTGKISKVGQSIVCLPNKAVIYIEGTDNNTEKVDEVVF